MSDTTLPILISALRAHADAVDGPARGQQFGAKWLRALAAMLVHGLGPGGLYAGPEDAVRRLLRSTLAENCLARRAAQAYDREGLPRPAHFGPYMRCVHAGALLLRAARRHQLRHA